MTFEIIISPVKDEKMNSHLQDSEVWKKAYKSDEITDRIRGMYPAWYEYTVKFDGLKNDKISRNIIDKICLIMYI